MSNIIPPEVLNRMPKKEDENSSFWNNVVIFVVFGLIFLIAIYFTFIRYSLIGKAIDTQQTGIAFGLASPEIASSISALMRI